MTHPLIDVVKTSALASFGEFSPLDVSVVPSAMVMPVGQTQALTVRVRDGKGNFVNAAIDIRSMDVGIAGLKERTVLGVAVGKTNVVVSAGGTSVVVPVRVVPAVEVPLQILGPLAAEVEALGVVPGGLRAEWPGGGGRGGTTPITVGAGGGSGPEDCDEAPVWSSSDPSVAVVSQQGVITALKAGTTVITARACGVTSNPYTFTVRPRAYQVRTTGPNGESALAMRSGEIVTVKGFATDPNGNALAIDGFLSDTPSVASVEDDGRTTAATRGSTRVRAHAAGVVALDANAVLIGVDTADQPPPPHGGNVDVWPASMELPVGNAQQIFVRARLVDGTEVTPPATFTPGAPGVVSVDANGLVTAVSPGTTLIAVAGPGYLKYVSVTVVPSADYGFRLMGPASMLVTAFGPLPTPLQANFDDVYWESSDPSVATIDQAGHVVARADGQTTITVRRGSQSATMTLRVDQRPSFITVHSTLPGDPRQILAYGPIAGVTVSATAFDFNGNPMPIQRIYSETGLVADVAGDTGGLLNIAGEGSTYLRAVSKGVVSDTPNSIRVVSLTPLTPPVLDPPQPSPSPTPSGSPSPPPPPPPAGCPTCDISPEERVLTVAPAAVTINHGQTFTLTWTVTNSAGVPVAVTPAFAVSAADATFVGVDAAGVVEGRAVGGGTVVVSTPGATSVNVPITVITPPGSTVTTNLSTVLLTDYGQSAVQLTAVTDAVGPVTWSDNANGYVTLDASGVLNVTGRTDTPAGSPAVLTASDASGNTANVAVTVTQSAKYVYVRMPSATFPVNPRAVTVASVTQPAFNVEAVARDANGFNAFNNAQIFLGLTRGGWEWDAVAPLPFSVTLQAGGPSAAVAAGVSTGRVGMTGNANATYVHFRGKGGLRTTVAGGTALEVSVGDAAASIVEATVTTP